MTDWKIQHYQGLNQAWFDMGYLYGKAYKNITYPTEIEAIKNMKKIIQKHEKENERLERDLRPNSYGASQIPPMRIIKV
jgi:hypothetical protein